MSKIAVVYWSGTGNTEQMANAVAEGAKEAGAEVSTLTADQFSAAKVAEFDAIAFGCPAMGAETLEEDEFEPMFTGCESARYTRDQPASVAPSFLHCANASSSGASQQMTLSQASTAPSERQVSSQVRIHSPSPQP